MSVFPFYARPTQEVLDLLTKFDPHRYLNANTSTSGSIPTPNPNNSQAATEQNGRGSVSVYSADLLCVVREWRGSGVARAMVDHLATLMHAARPMMAITVATNVRSQRLLKGKGYDMVAETNFHEYVVRDGLKCAPLDDDPKSIQLMAMRL